MNRKYSEEFKAEAVKQVVERGYPVKDVSERIGVSIKSLYGWLREAKRQGGGEVGRRIGASMRYVGRI